MIIELAEKVMAGGEITVAEAEQLVANGVKELVLAGMLLASRDIVGGIEWVAKEKDQEDIDKLAEKQKKQFAGCEIMGKKLGIIGLGAIGAMVANAASATLTKSMISIWFYCFTYAIYTSISRQRLRKAGAKIKIFLDMQKPY